MKRVKSESNFEKKGVMGLATAVKLNDVNLRLDFETDQTFTIKVNQSEEADERTVPTFFPFKFLKQDKKTSVKVTMNEGGDKVLFISPGSGTFPVKFMKFPSPEGVPPAPETFEGKKGKKSYRAFGAMFEIQKPSPWAGTGLWARFYPNFGKDEGGLLAIAGEGSGSDSLANLLEATGVANHEIQFSENPLPEIQEIAQKEATTFDVVIQKGWIDMIVVKEDEDAFAFPDVKKVHPALAD